jgi:pyruvate dehydrogenase E1 component alpha subunit
MTLNKEKSLELLKTMMKIRQFEERVQEIFAAGKIPGFVHLSIGQEAVPTGVCGQLRNDDYITSTHRGHGHIIAKGADYNRMMAELLGKKTGYCKGKGGSMHIADFDIGILGANAIVGGNLEIAVGAALSSQYRSTDQVTACMFGDGASNQGTFHEALNMASIWDLPVVFVCENNCYGMFTHEKLHCRVNDIADRASAYNIPGIAVDGNDITAVYEAAGEAIKRAREGKGPTLLECKTYRIRGHFEGDPVRYRDDKEVEEWRKKDPIIRFKKQLIEQGFLTGKTYDDIAREISQALDDAVKYAEESQLPDSKETLEDVFSS